MERRLAHKLHRTIAPGRFLNVFVAVEEMALKKIESTPRSIRYELEKPGDYEIVAATL
jgi:hypothetical protein